MNVIKHFKTTGVISILSLIFHAEVTVAQLPAKDTLTITLDSAEQLFIINNLQILAQKYSVDATKALIIQARLYPNPSINVEQGAYQTETHQWFPTGSTGEEAYGVSQLIVLSRKIHKQAKIAETNYKLAEDSLYDLLRTLKFALRSNFFDIYYLQQTGRVYDEEINSLKTIVSAYNEVKDKGYVSQAEIVQVQAQLYSLLNEYQTLVDNINDLQSQTRLLLQVSPNIYIRPVVNPEIVKADPFVYGFMTLMDSAYTNRPDFMIAKDNLLLSQQTYSLQKALAIPDLTLGAGLDKQGSYIYNFNYISLGIDIPIFNRNQGNIKNSNILIDYNNTQLKANQLELEEQITRGYQKAIDADKLYKGIDPSFAGNFDNLANEMVKNYMKRNVSLLTFMTFYDSYKTNIVQLNTISYNKVNALENMNYLTGTNFFNK